MSGITAAVSRLRGTLNVVYREMLKFGAVGAFAFVVDVGLFNLLTTDLWFGSGSPPLDGHEKLAKLISSSTAVVVAWLGNRYWSFRHRRQSSRGREFLMFVLMNVVATVVAVACLAISHDVLGLTSTLADNLSGNVIGVGLGTLFRFWAYRTFVFTQFIDSEGRDRGENPGAEPLHPGTEQANGPVPLDLRRPAVARDALEAADLAVDAVPETEPRRRAVS
ncbi:MAG: GtrA family protein [Kineosporiaceae bacterium]